MLFMGELPWFLVSEASESLVLNMTFDGFTPITLL